MKKNLKAKIFTVMLVSASLLAVPHPAAVAAIFDLSYTLTEGGINQMELNAANTYKGVQIKITVDPAVSYEVIQEIFSPLQNMNNPSEVIPDNNFVMRRIQEGNNAMGTFTVSSSDVTVRSVDRIFTNTGGTSSNFTLVYGIRNIEQVPPGHYHGRINFILRPLQPGTPQSSPHIMEIDVNVSAANRGGEVAPPAIEIITATGSKTIVLNSKKEEAQSVDIAVKLNGKFNNVFGIKQVLARPFESIEDGTKLDYEALNFQTREVIQGMGTPLTPLSQQPQTVYTSGPGGGKDDTFVVTYGLGDLSKQLAGRYRSSMRYYLERAGQPTMLLDTLDFEIENERIFDLVITMQDQKTSIEFTNLKPTEPPKTSEVVIEVKNNAGKRYQVTQKVESELIDKAGNVIAGKNFTLRTESADTKGLTKFPGKQEVKKGDTVLFVSDDQGSPDKFKVVYELAIPEIIKGGDYSTKISYSLSEI